MGMRKLTPLVGSGEVVVVWGDTDSDEGRSDWDGPFILDFKGERERENKAEGEGESSEGGVSVGVWGGDNDQDRGDTCDCDCDCDRGVLVLRGEGDCEDSSESL